MQKYILNLFLILFAVHLLSCNSNQKPVNEFEGVITYKATYYSKTDSTYYNDTLKCFYSHGNWIKIHLGTNPGRVKKDIYISDNRQHFFLRNNTDSLYWFDVSENSRYEILETKSQLESHDILSHKCEKFTVRSKDYTKGLQYLLITEYTFSRGYLTVDKAHFKDCNYDSFNKFTDYSNSFFLKFKYARYSLPDNKPISSIVYTAISIEEKKLDPQIFEVDKTKLIHIRQP